MSRFWTLTCFKPATGAGRRQRIRSAGSAHASKTPRMPVLVGETVYEGHQQTNWQDTQRFAFWVSIMNGAAGTNIWGRGDLADERQDHPARSLTLGNHL